MLTNNLTNACSNTNGDVVKFQQSKNWTREAIFISQYQVSISTKSSEAYFINLLHDKNSQKIIYINYFCFIKAKRQATGF